MLIIDIGNVVKENIGRYDTRAVHGCAWIALDEAGCVLERLIQLLMSRFDFHGITPITIELIHEPFGGFFLGRAHQTIPTNWRRLISSRHQPNNKNHGP